MDTIRTTVLFACCTALGLTLAEQLLPAGQFAKQIRMITAILMMTAILVPLAKLDLSQFRIKLEYSGSQAADLQAIADEMQEQAAAESIRNALNRALSEHQVNCRVLEVSVHIQSDGCISINEVTAEGNLLTGAVFLHEWLGDDVTVTEGGMPDAQDG